MTEKDKGYELVDVEGLATALAEEAWESEMKEKGVKKEDLYEPVVVANSDDPLQKQVRSHWAYNFFALRDLYLLLINRYKKTTDETRKKG